MKTIIFSAGTGSLQVHLAQEHAYPTKKKDIISSQEMFSILLSNQSIMHLAGLIIFSNSTQKWIASTKQENFKKHDLRFDIKTSGFITCRIERGREIFVSLCVKGYKLRTLFTVHVKEDTGQYLANSGENIFVLWIWSKSATFQVYYKRYWTIL